MSQSMKEKVIEISSNFQPFLLRFPGLTITNKANKAKKARKVAVIISVIECAAAENTSNE